MIEYFRRNVNPRVFMVTSAHTVHHYILLHMNEYLRRNSTYKPASMYEVLHTWLVVYPPPSRGQFIHLLVPGNGLNVFVLSPSTYLSIYCIYVSICRCIPCLRFLISCSLKQYQAALPGALLMPSKIQNLLCTVEKFRIFSELLQNT